MIATVVQLRESDEDTAGKEIRGGFMQATADNESIATQVSKVLDKLPSPGSESGLGLRTFPASPVSRHHLQTIPIHCGARLALTWILQSQPWKLKNGMLFVGL